MADRNDALFKAALVASYLLEDKVASHLGEAIHHLRAIGEGKQADELAGVLRRFRVNLLKTRTTASAALPT